MWTIREGMRARITIRNLISGEIVTSEAAPGEARPEARPETRATNLPTRFYDEADKRVSSPFHR